MPLYKVTLSCHFWVVSPGPDLARSYARDAAWEMDAAAKATADEVNGCNIPTKEDDLKMPVYGVIKYATLKQVLAVYVGTKELPCQASRT
jgi:hypothetical protein